LSDIVKRGLSGIVYVGVLVASLLINQYLFAFVFVTLAVANLLEFFKLGKRLRASAQQSYAAIITILLFAFSFASNILEHHPNLFLLLVPLVVFIIVFELYRIKRYPFVNIAYTIFGLVYIAVPFALMNYLVFYTGSFNGNLLLGIFVLTWIYDSGAYLVGITIGKNRLFERISPKKSWEGFIGGAAITIGLSFFAPNVFGIVSLTHWVVISAIVVIFGTLGDLSESLLKRSVNVKDSGQFMPGHGGVLDRFDSILLSVPLIYMYLYFFVKI